MYSRAGIAYQLAKRGYRGANIRPIKSHRSERAYLGGKGPNQELSRCTVLRYPVFLVPFEICPVFLVMFRYIRSF